MKASVANNQNAPGGYRAPDGERRKIGVRKSKANASQQLVFALLWLYVVLKPFYLFPSGVPQIADLILVLALIISALFIKVRIDKNTASVLKAGFYFSLYTVGVNLAWSLYLKDLGMVVYASYYIYNAMAMFVIFVCAAAARDQFERCIFWGAVVSSCVQLLVVLATGLDPGRETASFNNPNQLAYFSFIMLGFMLVTEHRITQKLYLYAGMGAAMALSLLALSKSGLVVSVLLILLHFVRRPVIAGLFVAAFLGGLVWTEQTEIIDRAYERIENIGKQKDDSIAGRGYMRLVNYPQYLVLGAGEGGFYRFKGGSTIEIHSTYATVLFSYGVIGFSLFTLFIYRIYRYTSLYHFFYLIPCFMYGLVHQGLRFSPLWIFLALVFICGHRERPG